MMTGPSGGVPAYAEARLPVWRQGNVFCEGTNSGAVREHRHEDIALSWEIIGDDGLVRLRIIGDEGLNSVDAIHHDVFGMAFQAECPFEDPQCGAIDWSLDVAGQKRPSLTNAGPSQGQVPATMTWPKMT